MSNIAKNILVWVAVAMVLVSVFNNFTGPKREDRAEIDYSTFLTHVQQGNVAQVEIADEIIRGSTHSGELFTTYAPNDPKLVDDLFTHGVKIKSKKEEETSLLVHLLISSFPILLLIGVWIFFMKQMQGGGRGGAFSFGKSKARMLTEDKNNVTFEDVAGVDEAKEEVGELVDFLSEPAKFQKLGGHIPRGVLMTGNPGTGKTLLAKAIAGEAKVPFYSIAGSDFVEMFVGVGASRVRDMFEQAKKSAPCIIFIDEIDAVGRQRGAGLGGGHDEREQTLNQLLVEMDGFDPGEGVIVIAATNRPDVLDPALLRPGRFDRQVYVPLPDIRGREAILKVHMRKVPVADDIDASIIARGTPGFSGADLANLINEAALFAAREARKLVGMEQFEKAKDKILMGLERRSMVMSEKERKNTAYHESGHTVVAKVLHEYTDPVHKVTIIPRGRALGVTMQLPEEDQHSYNSEYLLARIAVLHGGRIAEEVFMGQKTTGAENDFEQATKMAQNMVSRWGMSEAMGPRVYGENTSEVFLGREMASHRNVSPQTAEKVEQEISRIINEQYTRARKIIEKNRAKVEKMAATLLEWETLDAQQVDDIMHGKKPKPPPAGERKPTAAGAGAKPKPTAAADAESKGGKGVDKDRQPPKLDESDLDLNPGGLA